MGTQWNSQAALDARTEERREVGERRHVVMIDCNEHEHKTAPLIGAVHARTGHRRGASERRYPAMIDCYEHDYETQPLNMIECTTCKHGAYSTVEYVEGEALINGGLVSRPCHHCGITTMWKQFDLPAAASSGWSTVN